MLPPTGGTLSAGTGTGDQYLWVGPASGDWNDAANWKDLSTQADPATIAPGTLDSVTFHNSQALEQIIGGSGDAATLTLFGENMMTGSFNVGTLAFGTDNVHADVLTIAAGGTLLAASVADGVVGQVFVSGPGALLRATGNLGGNGAWLDATQGGIIQISGLSVVGAGEMQVDASSAIEIGTRDSAAPGWIAVDAGATLAAANTSSFYALQLDGSVLDNGLISAVSSLNFDGSLLTGNGIVALQSGAAGYVGGSIGGALDFQLGTGALLSLGLAGSGDNIELACDNTLALNPLYTLTSQGSYSYAGVHVDAPISG